MYTQALLKYKPSLLVAVPSQAGYDDVQCFSFNSNAPELELELVECVPGPVSNHLVQNTVMVRLSASLPLYLTSDENSKCSGSQQYKLLYSQKYWWELNLAVGSQMAIAKALADFNLAVRYGIAIRIYASKKFWRILIWRLLS